MNYFAKFEKFLPHSIIITSFMTIGSQMPELDRGVGGGVGAYKIGSQNTPYKLGLMKTCGMVFFTIIGSTISIEENQLFTLEL